MTETPRDTFLNALANHAPKLAIEKFLFDIKDTKSYKDALSKKSFEKEKLHSMCTVWEVKILTKDTKLALIEKLLEELEKRYRQYNEENGDEDPRDQFLKKFISSESTESRFNRLKAKRFTKEALEKLLKKKGWTVPVLHKIALAVGVSKRGTKDQISKNLVEHYTTRVLNKKRSDAPNTENAPSPNPERPRSSPDQPGTKVKNSEKSGKKRATNPNVSAPDSQSKRPRQKSIRGDRDSVILDFLKETLAEQKKKLESKHLKTGDDEIERLKIVCEELDKIIKNPRNKQTRQITVQISSSRE